MTLLCSQNSLSLYFSLCLALSLLLSLSFSLSLSSSIPLSVSVIKLFPYLSPSFISVFQSQSFLHAHTFTWNLLLLTLLFFHCKLSSLPLFVINSLFLWFQALFLPACGKLWCLSEMPLILHPISRYFIGNISHTRWLQTHQPFLTICLLKMYHLKTS